MKSINRIIKCITIFIAVTLTGCGQHNETQTERPENVNVTESPEKKDSLFQSSYAIVNGLKMYYEIHGSGQPLVLLHGGDSTIYTTFGRILPVLSKNHQVIAVELQAHGHSGDRDSPESFEQDADDVTELLKQLNISKADIFGFSNGGSTAIQIAIRHPDQVNKLVAVSAIYKRDGMQAGFWDFMKKRNFQGHAADLQG